jgi:AraC family transcriptional regulator
MKRTKQTSAQEYQKRINKALTYIRDNLDKPLLLSEVSREACFSEFHFHRIFSALMRETLGEYVTRKKLERAAMKLAYAPALKVSTIAEEYGYASVSSFSKAFNEWFGCRPTEFKKSNAGWIRVAASYKQSMKNRLNLISYSLPQTTTQIASTN